MTSAAVIPSERARATARRKPENMPCVPLRTAMPYTAAGPGSSPAKPLGPRRPSAARFASKAARSPAWSTNVSGGADGPRHRVHRAGAPLPPAERGDADRISHAARTAALGPAARTAAFDRGTSPATEDVRALPPPPTSPFSGGLTDPPAPAERWVTPRRGCSRTGPRPSSR
ncbi:hypothetical protein [Streptomyces sp. NPDC001889]